ncbi:MAG: hypothetical protein F4180_04435, partial [Chloroflexi bacterium]|nr:hypothetical protein [Chloroflexota bacterium]
MRQNYREAPIAVAPYVQEHEEMMLKRVRMLGLRKFGLITMLSVIAFAMACGSAESTVEDGNAGSGDGGGVAAAVEDVSSGPPGVEIISTDAVYTVDD